MTRVNKNHFWHCSLATVILLRVIDKCTDLIPYLDMSYANSTNVQGLGIYAVIGCDDQYFYTLDSTSYLELLQRFISFMNNEISS